MLRSSLILLRELFILLKSLRIFACLNSIRQFGESFTYRCKHNYVPTYARGRVAIRDGAFTLHQGVPISFTPLLQTSAPN